MGAIQALAFPGHLISYGAVNINAEPLRKAANQRAISWGVNPNPSTVFTYLDDVLKQGVIINRAFHHTPLPILGLREQAR